MDPQQQSRESKAERGENMQLVPSFLEVIHSNMTDKNDAI